MITVIICIFTAVSMGTAATFAVTSAWSILPAKGIKLPFKCPGCTGCIRRREQLRQAKDRLLSKLTSYKGQWEIGLDRGTQNDIDRGFVPLSVSNKHITKEALRRNVITSSAIEGIDATRVLGAMPAYPPKTDNPYNLTAHQFRDLREGFCVYHEQADHTSIKYLGDEYRMNWLRYQDEKMT